MSKFSLYSHSFSSFKNLMSFRLALIILATEVMLMYLIVHVMKQ